MKQKHWQVSVFDKTSETIKNDTFYTTDTEAYLIFELIDEDFTPDSAMVTVYNIYGKATINASVEVAGGIVQYEMPEEAIGHPGGWRTQVIYTKDNEDYTTKIIEFDVGGHLLDNKKPAIVDIENWNSFIAHAEELIDDWEQLEEIRQTNEQQRELAESARQNEFETNEAERESTFEINESARQANELIREEAEGNRQSTFEEKEAGRQSEFEENEQGRESSESERVSNEEERELNESERILKDSERDSKIEAVVDDVNSKLDSNVDIQLTNLVNNGDFKDGTEGWESLNGNITSSGEVLSLVGTGTNDYVYADQDLGFKAKKGDKFYFRAQGTVSTVECLQIRIVLREGVNGREYMTFINNPSENKIYSPSGIADIQNDFTQNAIIRLNHVYRNAEMANGKTAEFGDVKTINLTDIFGQAAEPTKEEMDALIDIIGWFDGEITLTQKQQLVWALNLIRKNRNAITELGGGIV